MSIVVGLAILPLIPPAILLGLHWAHLKTPGRPEEAYEYNSVQGACLNLAGFALAAIALAATLFKDDLVTKSTGTTLLFGLFVVAFADFIMAYVILRVRVQRRQLFVADVCVDHGLWCGLLGIALICWKFPALERVAYIVGAVAVVVFATFVYGLEQQRKVWERQESSDAAKSKIHTEGAD